MAHLFWNGGSTTYNQAANDYLDYPLRHGTEDWRVKKGSAGSI